MVSSDLVLLILACIVIGMFLGIWGAWKLIKYGFKNMSLEEIKLKIDKSLREQGGELKKFGWDEEEKIFEIQFCFPELRKRVEV